MNMSNTEMISVAGTRRQLLAGAAALGLAGVTGSGPAAAQQSGTLRVAMTLTDIPRLWAGPDGGFEGLRFAGYTIFDSLIAWDMLAKDKPAGIIPGLATSWSMDPSDRKRWIVKLRKDVFFHDGTRFDADAAVWNFASLFDDKAPQYNATRSGGIRSRLPSLAGAQKIDDETIAVLTNVEDSLTPYQLTFVLFASPTQFAKVGNDWIKFSADPAGTGPFKVKTVVPRTSLEVVRNEAYWNKARVPKLGSIVFRPIPDANARIASLRSGEVDFIESVAPDTIASLKAAGMSVTTNLYPHTWIWFFSFLPDSPFKDVRVRKAANLAVDRAGLVAMLNDTAAAAEGSVVANSPWFGKPSFKLKYDIEAAKKLMAEAGYSPAKPAKAKILISASGGGQMQPLPMNEFIQSSLASIGLQIDFEVVDFTNLFTYYRTGAASPDAKGSAGLNLALPSLDPTSGFVRVFSSWSFPPRGTNWGQYVNPAVDAALKAAQTSSDQASLDKAIATAHELLVDDAAALYVVHDLNPRAMAARVKGFVHSQSWFIDFSTVSIG